MAIRTGQAPPRGTRKPGHPGPGLKPSPFQPRPFGETAPAPSVPPLDLQTQIERAGRFGHNLAHLSLPSAGEAPIQRKETPAERAKRLAREADKLKLQGMFNVTDDPLSPQTPHRMTTKEFDEIAELYSQIREGDSHVKIANRSKTGENKYKRNAMSKQELASFKGKTMDDIAKILQTPEGRTVLKYLGAGGKTGKSDVTIGDASNPVDASSTPSSARRSADGRGSGSTVYYKAGTDINLPPDQDMVPITSDTVLFHELVHSYHMSQGTRKPANQVVDLSEIVLNDAHPRDAGVRKEEHAATGVGSHARDAITENAYRASHRQLAGANQALADKYKERKTYRKRKLP